MEAAIYPPAALYAIESSLIDKLRYHLQLSESEREKLKIRLDKLLEANQALQTTNKLSNLEEDTKKLHHRNNLLQDQIQRLITSNARSNQWKQFVHRHLLQASDEYQKAREIVLREAYEPHHSWTRVKTAAADLNKSIREIKRHFKQTMACNPTHAPSSFSSLNAKIEMACNLLNDQQALPNDFAICRGQIKSRLGSHDDGTSIPDEEREFCASALRRLELRFSKTVDYAALLAVFWDEHVQNWTINCLALDGCDCRCHCRCGSIRTTKNTTAANITTTPDDDHDDLGGDIVDDRVMLQTRITKLGLAIREFERTYVAYKSFSIQTLGGYYHGVFGPGVFESTYPHLATRIKTSGGV